MGAWLAVLAPLVGVPLAAITFYLRALREQGTGRLGELGRRVDRLDQAVAELARRLDDVNRDFTTKEEWIRESMLARSERQWLTQAVARMQSSDEATKPRSDEEKKGRRHRGNKATGQRVRNSEP